MGPWMKYNNACLFIKICGEQGMKHKVIIEIFIAIIFPNKYEYVLQSFIYHNYTDLLSTVKSCAIPPRAL